MALMWAEDKFRSEGPDAGGSMGKEGKRKGWKDSIKRRRGERREGEKTATQTKFKSIEQWKDP